LSSDAVQNAPPTRHLLKLATISLRRIPAFFRSRNEQVIVELALRQQLATFSQKGTPTAYHSG
jgi:hypothetical protein